MSIHYFSMVEHLCISLLVVIVDNVLAGPKAKTGLNMC